MKIPVWQITESPKEARFSESIEDLNEIYGKGMVPDFHFPPFLDVHVAYYRAGRDLYFQGWLGGNIEGRCSRCLKSYCFQLKKSFDFVLTPDPLLAKSRELNRDEMGLSFYSAEDINFLPLSESKCYWLYPFDHCVTIVAAGFVSDAVQT